MKMKKSLLALSTAAAVAVAGAPAAFAADSNTSSQATAQSSELTGSLKTEGGVSGSVDNFFGWKPAGTKDKDGKDISTTGLTKLKDIGALLAAIIAVITGVSKLAETIQGLAK